MAPVAETAVVALINAAFEVLRIYLNKPEGWRPTQTDWDNFQTLVDAATPENVKAEVARRLGVSWTPEP